MLKIRQAVGVYGSNQYQDVLTIQKALNKVRPLLRGKRLTEDGLYGTNTASAISEFQVKYVKMVKPDGQIDPGGKSIVDPTKYLDSSAMY